MKKIVLALLVVLLLGTFVACNGEVDFLLWEDAVETKPLTLKTDNHYLSFDKDNPDVQEKTFYIPATAETWADLVNVLSFTIYDNFNNSSYNMTCSTYWDYIIFSVNDNNSLYFYVYLQDNHVWQTSPIDSSATYELLTSS